MQLRRTLIIASYLSICLCLITYDTSATRGSRSTAEPGVGTYQQGKDKVVAATTGAFEAQGIRPTLGNYGNALVHSTYLGTVSAPQGVLTNGATHTGVIQVGGTDTWTIDGTTNDRITVSVGEVRGMGFFRVFNYKVQMVRCWVIRLEQMAGIFRCRCP